MQTRTRYKHPLWGRYRMIKYHCENDASGRWPSYGGQGIQLHAPWSRDFWAFADWIEQNLGLPGGSHDHLDRKNNTGDYKPGNVMWATAKQNHNNRRNNRLLRVGRRTQTLSEWCDELGMWNTTVITRLDHYGCTPAEALGFKPHARVRQPK